MVKALSKRIGILTGGGDCPGLNAVIRAATKTAFYFGWEVIGIENSFEGLIKDRMCRRLTAKEISGILHLGGTILGTTNKGNPFKYRVKEKGKVIVKDLSDVVIHNFKKMELDALIVIGGDGTLSIANRLSKKGLPIIGIPKTIDNDLAATVITFGFDTAVNCVTNALDRLHTTAQSHHRVMVLEVMGRYCGWIALNGGISGGADVILIPEIPFDINKVCEKIEERNRTKRNFSIVVVSEGAKPLGGEAVVQEKARPGSAERLGGIGEWVGNKIHQLIKRETRVIVLGHLQRGGQPTTFDRLLGTRFGSAAVRLIKEQCFGCMVALKPPNIVPVSLEEAVSSLKKVSLDSNVIQAGRDMGICFGD